ncbi:Hypothetical predicted protein, partial [Olea europaea subsp. europaea]
RRSDRYGRKISSKQAGITIFGDTRALSITQIEQSLHLAPTNGLITPNNTENQNLQPFLQTTNTAPSSENFGPPPPATPHPDASNQPMGHHQFRANIDKLKKISNTRTGLANPFPIEDSTGLQSFNYYWYNYGSFFNSINSSVRRTNFGIELDNNQRERNWLFSIN